MFVITSWVYSFMYFVFQFSPCTFVICINVYQLSSFFFLIFSIFVWIFSNFSVLSFNSHKLFFLKLSIRIIKPKRNHFGMKLYLSVCCIYLCHLYLRVSGFFFFAYLFLLCVDIFKLCSHFLKI